MATANAQIDTNKVVYLIPGTGSDARLFQALNIPASTKVIEYSTPEKGMNMAEYSQVLAQQIDTSSRFSIIGVSLGGMLAIEMSKYLQPEEVIVVASAKTRKELPATYRFFQKVPIYHLIGGRTYKFFTRLFQPFYEPLSEEDEAIWQSMLAAKEPKFMRRAVPIIVKWENESYDSELVTHIHGTKDKTIPVKNVQDAIILEDATHMMMMDRAEEVSALIRATISL